MLLSSSMLCAALKDFQEALTSETAPDPFATMDLTLCMNGLNASATCSACLISCGPMAAFRAAMAAGMVFAVRDTTDVVWGAMISAHSTEVVAKPAPQST